MGYSPGRSPREPSMSIPIPSHYPSSMGSMGSAERSPRPLPSPSSSRSPSQSSLASYRAHPYPRRSSLTQQQGIDNDRILLPPPNSNSPLHVLHEGRHEGRRRDSGEEHERTHSADRAERERDQQRERERERERGEWRDRRPSLARTHSDGRFTSSDRSDRSFQLPPFSSLTASATSSPSTYPGGPLTPTSNGAAPPSGAPMGPPGVPASTSPNGSRAASPKLFGLGGLRPSYSYDAPSANPSGGRLGLTNAGPGCYRSEYSPPRYGERERDPRDQRDQRAAGGAGGVGPDRSPPLRSIHQSHPHQYTDAYQQGRARSHSAASALGRYPHQAPGAGPRSSSSDGDWQSPPTPREVQAPYPAPGGGGQSRRLAHLMSEQKRRESINTGFQALRTALPTSIPTDSKAIILRKAVSHITHLEGLLRKAGISIAVGAGGVKDDDSLPEGEEEGDEDVVMRETTGGVRDLSVQLEKGKWEEVQVEDVAVERKPTVA